MLTRNGSCVTAIMKTSAGSSGSRRRHGEEKGSPTFPLTFSVASAVVTLTSELLPDRAGGYLLALTERRAAFRRPGDHTREKLGAPVADILELRNAYVLH